MNPDVLHVLQDSTVREAIRYLRQADVDEDEEVFQIYTTDPDGRLSGTVSPRRLLVSGPEVRLAAIQDAKPLSVTTDEDQEQVLQLFMKYDLTALPVVSSDDHLVGHITVDDVMDVAAEEADEDIYHMAGTDPAELETSSIFRASGIRFVWLLPSFAFMAGTAAVILTSKSHFEPRVHGVLLAFVPMIGALAGCCSVQTSTIITRGLATGELAPSMMRLAFLREGRIALVLAPACAVVAWIVAQIGMPLLRGSEAAAHDAVSIVRVANAVGLGMITGITLASLLGITMPFVFRRLRIDPAIAAGPVVTGANDVICVSIYLGIAYYVVAL
jgi:magnesium transporter